MHPKIVTITGDVGSGKSTAVRRLAEMWAVEIYSTGAAFRQLAEEMGVTVLEVNKRAESEPEIDRKIDSIFASLAQSDRDLLVDSRVAWHFLPGAYKVRLTVDPLIAAQRIAEDPARTEELKNIRAPEDIAHRLEARKASEVERFRKAYGINITDPANFDLVIDTTEKSPEDVIWLIADGAESFFAECAPSSVAPGSIR